MFEAVNLIPDPLKVAENRKQVHNTPLDSSRLVGLL